MRFPIRAIATSAWRNSRAPSKPEISAGTTVIEPFDLPWTSEWAHDDGEILVCSKRFRSYHNAATGARSLPNNLSPSLFLSPARN